MARRLVVKHRTRNAVANYLMRQDAHFPQQPGAANWLNSYYLFTPLGPRPHNGRPPKITFPDDKLIECVLFCSVLFTVLVPCRGVRRMGTWSTCSEQLVVGAAGRTATFLHGSSTTGKTGHSPYHPHTNTPHSAYERVLPECKSVSRFDVPGSVPHSRSFAVAWRKQMRLGHAYDEAFYRALAQRVNAGKAPAWEKMYLRDVELFTGHSYTYRPVAAAVPPQQQQRQQQRADADAPPSVEGALPGSARLWRTRRAAKLAAEEGATAGTSDPTAGPAGSGSDSGSGPAS